MQNILSMRLRSFYGKIATFALFKVVFGAKKVCRYMFWEKMLKVGCVSKSAGGKFKMLSLQCSNFSEFIFTY